MCDIFEFCVARLAAGHGDEKPVRTVDDFDVVNDETVVDGDGCHGFQLAVVLFNEANPYFRNIQDCSSFAYIAVSEYILLYNFQFFKCEIKIFC